MARATTSLPRCINPQHKSRSGAVQRFTPQFRPSNTLSANNYRSRGPLAFGRGSPLTTYGWRAIMITNKKATTVRTWFRRLTAARLILLMLTCLPVWGKSPQTVSNQDLMNMKVASASKQEDRKNTRLNHRHLAIY